MRRLLPSPLLRSALPLLFAFGFGCSSTGLELPTDGDGGIDGSPDGISPDAACGVGYESCPGAGCVSTLSDPLHCGGCGIVCGSGEFCSAGACVSTCAAPLARCGDICVDIIHDPTNCGGCGLKCVAGEVCTSTGCALACPDGLLACKGSCFDTKNDPLHCGGCETACGADEVCRDGTCASTCSSPLKKCGTICVNLAYDPNNCGICGNKCVGTPCLEGGCGVVDKTDDDDDTISNFHESKSFKLDTDKDGIPDYLDPDSDNDGMTDKAEAGDLNVVTPPLDSDGDTIPDFQDFDSDNDGLTDKDEFGKYKTSPTKPDTDGDGYTDGEEIYAGTDPLDPKSNPGTIGGFSFDLPYKGLPRTQELTFRPRLQKADVAFIVDTTGSMGGSITGIRTSLASITTKLKAKIPDTAFGVGNHKDFPVGGYGDASDFPFRLEQRITTVIADAQRGVNLLTASGGADLPESQIEGIFLAAKGSGFKSKGGTKTWTAKFDPDLGFDETKGHGKRGGMGFRADAAPIFVLATDATFHHAPGDKDAPSSAGVFDNYAATSFGTADDERPHTVKETLDALSAIGAKFIGIEVQLGGGGPNSPRRQEEYFAMKTGAVVPSKDGATCPHGIGGAAIPASVDDTGKKVCPLVFSTSSSGAGIDTAIVDAITTLATFVNFKTIWLEARDNTTTTFDERTFFRKGIPVSFATPLPPGCSAPATGDLLPAPSGDGIFDSFTSVCPGTIVTFSLVMQNLEIPPKCEDQIFAFKIVVVGDRTFETDARVITVRVPGQNTLCVK